MKIKFLTDKGSFIKAGDIGDYPEETAKSLIERKIAEAIPPADEVKSTKKTNNGGA